MENLIFVSIIDNLDIPANNSQVIYFLDTINNISRGANIIYLYCCRYPDGAANMLFRFCSASIFVLLSKVEASFLPKFQSLRPAKIPVFLNKAEISMPQDQKACPKPKKKKFADTNVTKKIN